MRFYTDFVLFANSTRPPRIYFSGMAYFIYCDIIVTDLEFCPFHNTSKNTTYTTDMQANKQYL